MNKSIIVSNEPGCYIQLLHDDANPTVWIVRRSKKIFGFKKRISSDWFTNGQRALDFARKAKREHALSANAAPAKGRPKLAE